MIWLGLALIALGVVVLLWGTRLMFLGAGVGALLGIGLLRLIPGAQESWIWFLVPIGLAIALALAGGFMKGLVGIITIAIGAFAGGAIVLAVFDALGINLGLLDWVLALGGAVIGALLMMRFKDWGVIILAALIGALLATRGLQYLLPSLQGTIGTIIGLVIAAAAIAYHGGFIGGRKAEPAK